MSRPYPTFRVRGRRIRLCHRSGLKTTRRERRVERHWLLFESPQPNRTKLRHLGSRIYGGRIRIKKLATSPGWEPASRSRLDGPCEFAILQTPPEDKSEGGTIYFAIKRL